MVEKFLARPTDGFNKSTLIYRFHTAVYVSIPRTVCQLASCQLKRKQGKKVCKATALRSCHCFPCTMLSVLSRPNWLWEKKSYSAQLLTAAERCKKWWKCIFTPRTYREGESVVLLAIWCLQISLHASLFTSSLQLLCCSEEVSRLIVVTYRRNGRSEKWKNDDIWRSPHWKQDR